MDYIEIPILLRLNLVGLPNFDVFAGPDFAFDVFSRVKNAYSSTFMTTSEKGTAQVFDFYIAFGGGPNFNLGPANVGVELRFALGTEKVVESWLN